MNDDAKPEPHAPLALPPWGHAPAERGRDRAMRTRMAARRAKPVDPIARLIVPHAPPPGSEGRDPRFAELDELLEVEKEQERQRLLRAQARRGIGA